MAQSVRDDVETCRLLDRTTQLRTANAYISPFSDDDTAAQLVEASTAAKLAARSERGLYICVGGRGSVVFWLLLL
jgi:hypothetical protein